MTENFSLKVLKITVLIYGLLLHMCRISRVFPWRLTGGGICTNSLLFKNKRCCFPYCFLQIFVGDKTVIETDKVMMGGGGAVSLPLRFLFIF